MGQTIVEKIFSKKLHSEVYRQEVNFVPVDLAMATDGTAPLAIQEFKKLERIKLFDQSKIVLVDDHFSPAKDIKTSKLSNAMKGFAKEYGIEHYYPVGKNGICHVLLPEKGLVRPFDIVAGADSHTCTYGGLSAFGIGIGSTDFAGIMATGKLWMRVPETIKVQLHGTRKPNVQAKDIILWLIHEIGVSGANYDVLEFTGECISTMGISERLTLCNMAAETGAKTGMIGFDQVTAEYYQRFGLKYGEDAFLMNSDPDANYKEIMDVDISVIEQLIACPYSPAKVKKVTELEGMPIDQVVIGSCTNGRIEDFRVAYQFLKGKRVAEQVKLIIIPGSQQVLLDMIIEGILQELVEAGAAICPPSCGPCVGGHLGVLSEGEIGLYTTNRNFYARNGDETTKVYLCNPAVAASSAVSGVITEAKIL